MAALTAASFKMMNHSFPGGFDPLLLYSRSFFLNFISSASIVKTPELRPYWGIRPDKCFLLQSRTPATHFNPPPHRLSVRSSRRVASPTCETLHVRVWETEPCMWAVFAARPKEEQFQFVADIKLARKPEYDFFLDWDFSDSASNLNPVKWSRVK